jgi:hypothetical protein
MASVNTITQTTPTVKRELEIMSNVILETDVFTKFKVIPAVRDKFSMFNGSVSGMSQDYSDNPTETGTTTLSDEEFTIYKGSIFHGVPYDKFKDTEFNVSISDLKSQGLPPQFVDMVSSLAGKSISKDAAVDIYNGAGGLTGDPTGKVNGLAKIIKDKLTAASLTSQIVTDATNNPALKGGVELALAALKATFTDDVIEMKEDFVFLMNGVVNDAHYEALSEVAATNIPQASALNYLGYNIEIARGLSSRRIIFCRKENINVSLAISGDLVSLDIVDMYALGGGNKARIVGNYGYGVGIATTDFFIFEFTA